MLSRRTVLGATAAAAFAGPLRAAERRDIRVMVCGQSLLEFELSRVDWSGRRALRRKLRGAHAAFTDFEGTVRGPRAGEPTRVLETLHTPSAEALDFLSDMGFSLFATANNHAFDLGTGGILDTIEAMRSRKLDFAGTGLTLADASAPVLLGNGRADIALVAGAVGAIRPGGAATPDRPGVNELRLTAARTLEPADRERYLAAVALAAASGGPVIAYLHNHDWEADNADTPAWQRDFARAAVDAGASVFVAHGPPLLHGIELYRGAPLFHGLGSLFFQTRKADDAYGPLNWQALIADCHFRNGRFMHARLEPWSLAAEGIAGPHRAVTRGVPQPASREQARAILDRVAERSARLGHGLDHDGRVGAIRVG